MHNVSRDRDSHRQTDNFRVYFTKMGLTHTRPKHSRILIELRKEGDCSLHLIGLFLTDLNFSVYATIAGGYEVPSQCHDFSTSDITGDPVCQSIPSFANVR